MSTPGKSWLLGYECTGESIENSKNSSNFQNNSKSFLCTCNRTRKRCSQKQPGTTLWVTSRPLHEGWIHHGLHSWPIHSRGLPKGQPAGLSTHHHRLVDNYTARNHPEASQSASSRGWPYQGQVGLSAAWDYQGANQPTSPQGGGGLTTG
jgi:hypothetical protein